MVLSVFLIAVASYALSLLDVCGYVSRFAFKDPVPADARVDYFFLYRRHKWMGVGYAMVADLLRALITVLIGGMLLKGAGFPSIGKLLALLFSLIGQAMPLLPLDRHLTSKRELIFPALTLLFVDWRLRGAGGAGHGSHGEPRPDGRRSRRRHARVHPHLPGLVAEGIPGRRLRRRPHLLLLG